MNGAKMESFLLLLLIRVLSAVLFTYIILEFIDQITNEVKNKTKWYQCVIMVVNNSSLVNIELHMSHVNSYKKSLVKSMNVIWIYVTQELIKQTAYIKIVFVRKLFHLPIILYLFACTKIPVNTVIIRVKKQQIRICVLLRACLFQTWNDL